jgi:hypothetical protein
LHGCPDCSTAAFAYVDPEPAAHLGDEHLEHLVALYVDEAGCQICTEILVRDAWARYPGWECEVTCLVQHCEVCGLCGRSGRVCRECGVCIEHEEQGGARCWTTVWSRARRCEVEVYVHQLWDPATGRWKR